MIAQQLTVDASVGPPVWAKALTIGLAFAPFVAFVLNKAVRDDMDAWRIMAAMALSGMVDLAAPFMIDGSNWWRWPVYYFGTAWLLLPVLWPREVGSRGERLFLGIIFLATVVAMVASWPMAPELTIAAALWFVLAAMALARRALGPVRTGLLVYFGLSVPFIVMYALGLRFDHVFARAIWWPWQAVQVAGFLLIAWGIHRRGRTPVLKIASEPTRRVS